MLKWLLALAIALVVLTALSPWLSRYGLGRLPGDIVIRRENFSFYFPIVTCLIVSAVLSVIL